MTVTNGNSPLIVSSYFFLGYVINKLIMGPLVRLVFAQESNEISVKFLIGVELEGDFRFSHIRVRMCAESIALFDGAERERQDTELTFQQLLNNKMRILRWHLSLNCKRNFSEISNESEHKCVCLCGEYIELCSCGIASVLVRNRDCRDKSRYWLEVFLG